MRLLLSASFALALLAQGALGGQRTEQWIGAWEITSHRDDRSGAFSHCVATASYRSGISVLVSIDDQFNWRMGFLNLSWDLREGDRHQVSYWVDRNAPVAASATVVGRHFVVVQLPGDGRLFEAFRRGHVLNVRAERELFEFSLKDSSASLQAALNCATRHVDRRPSNPFAKREVAQGSGAKTAAYKAEATTMLANLLSAANVPGFELAENNPSGYSEYHAFFVAPGMVGGVIIADMVNVQDATAAVAAGATERCSTGRLASAQAPSDNGGIHLKYSCIAQGAPENETSYFIVPRGRGGVYLIELTSVFVSNPDIVSKLPDATDRKKVLDAFSDGVMDAGWGRSMEKN